MRRVPKWLWFVQEASGLDSLDNSIHNLHVLDVSGCELVPAFDDLVATDLYKGNGLGVARFEAY